MKDHTVIDVKKLKHRGQLALVLCFGYNNEFASIAKGIGASFTKTHSGWWLLWSKENLQKVFNAYKGKAWLELTYKKASTETAKPRKPKPLEDIVPKTYVEKLSRLGYSKSTIRTYHTYFNQFLHYHKGADPSEMGAREVEKFQNALVKSGRFSTNTQRQAANALKFYFEKVLIRPKEHFYIDIPKKEKKLPVVLSKQEVIRIIKVTKNQKHKMILALLYSSGMRIGELLSLRIADIDFDRDMIFIKAAKGKKDRMTVMSAFLKPFLMDYLHEYKPKYWLIEGPVQCYKCSHCIEEKYYIGRYKERYYTS